MATSMVDESESPEIAEMSDNNFTENCESLDCPVCLEKFKSPRTLPCQHTFCEECLSSYIVTQTRKTQGSLQFSCPVCRRDTLPEDPKSPTDEWVKTFPVNHLFVSLLDSKKSGSSDDLSMCAPCQRANETNTATFWCHLCFEPYCDTCNGYHKRMKTLNKHTTVPIEHVIQSLPKRIVHVDEDCSIHAGKVIEAYCFDHGVLCCVICVTKSHRQCQNVSPLDEIAEEQINENRRQEVVNIFTNLTKQVSRMVTEKEGNLITLASEKEELVNQMQTQISKVKEKLDDLMRKFEKDTVEVLSNNSMTVTKIRDQIQRLEKNLEICRKTMATVAVHGSSKQVFITFERLKQQIVSHYRQLQNILAEDEKVNLEIVLDEDLSKVMNSLDCLCRINAQMSPASTVREVNASIGEIMQTFDLKSKKLDKRSNSPPKSLSADATSSSSDVTPSSAKSHETTEMNRSSKTMSSGNDNRIAKQTADLGTSVDLLTLKVKLIKVLTVHDLPQGWMFFSGGAFLEDGRLLIADNNTQRLLVFRENYEYAGDYQIDGRPSDISVKGKDIYVLVNQNAVLKCAFVENKGTCILQTVKRIKAPGRSMSVELLGDLIIIGTTTSVVILSQDGTVITSSQTHGVCTHVAVSSEQCTYYLRDGNSIVCKTFEGNDVWRFGHKRLKEPTGICLDSNENVYICGRDSGNVFQTSFDGKTCRILPGKLQSITKPYAIIFHPVLPQFIVTSCGQETLFEVYSFYA